MYHPAGQKFARNRSISYGFRDIDPFPFSTKIHPVGPKFARNRSISYGFPQNSKMAAESGEN